MISLKVINGKKVTAAFKRAPAAFSRGLKGAVEKTAGFTQGEVIGVISRGEGMWKRPIDTGQMWQGITMRKAGSMSARIETSGRTPYAKYVHDGTSKMRARPFMQITADTKEAKIQKFFNAEVDKIVRRIFK